MFELCSVSIARMLDTSPDISYLEPDEHKDAQWQDNDAHRLAAYHRGDWEAIGIRAEAIVHHRPNATASATIHTFTSGGLWGVESDSSTEYLQETAAEEVAALRDILTDLAGIDLQAFSTQATDACQFERWRERGPVPIHEQYMRHD